MVSVQPVVLDDRQLIKLARAGDSEAYGALVSRYQAIAHRTALLIGGASDADDVVQEAFVRAYHALPRFRPDAPFRPWLLKIVANSAKNRSRSTGRRRAVDVRVAAACVDPSGASAEDEAVRHDQRAHLLTAIQGLPDKLRDVVACRYLLELSEAETAAVLSCPTGTVKSRLARALDQLRHVVGRQTDA